MTLRQGSLAGSMPSIVGTAFDPLLQGLNYLAAGRRLFPQQSNYAIWQIGLAEAGDKSRRRSFIKPWFLLTIVNIL
jgi:hypothetical protein